MSELLRAIPLSQAVSPADYLVFGTWIFVPGDPTATSDYDFGAFAGGGSPFGSAGSFATDRLPIDAYTATYNGRAHGLYYTDRSSATPSVGAFNAHVAMTADFELQAGEIDAGTLSGIVENIRYDGAAPGFPAQVVLEVTDIESFYVNSSRGMSAAGVARDGEPTPTWAGQWQAVFFRELSNPYEDPTAVAGTFGATNDQDGMVGAFGAR